jgi:hypothetical protein
LINIEAAAGDEDVDEEVEEPNIEVGGTAAPQYVADEGENIPRIVEQLRDEDHEFDEAMNAERFAIARPLISEEPYARDVWAVVRGQPHDGFALD